MTVKDCLKDVPKGAKILVGTREYDLNKVVHIEGNVYNAFLKDGGEGFACRVSAEHEVLVPKPAAPSTPKSGAKKK